METKNKEDVFFPELEIMELQDKQFKNKGEISFLLSRSGIKRFRKLLKIHHSDFGRKGRSRGFGKVMFILNGIRFLYHSFMSIVFDSRLENVNSFYIIHQSVIKEVQEAKYSENPKCTVITFMRKKNPPVSWPSQHEMPSNKAPQSTPQSGAPEL